VLGTVYHLSPFVNGEHVCFKITLPVYKRDPPSKVHRQVVLEMPNKHTTNDTIKNNTTKADENGQRNGLTNARNK